MPGSVSQNKEVNEIYCMFSLTFRYVGLRDPRGRQPTPSRPGADGDRRQDSGGN